MNKSELVDAVAASTGASKADAQKNVEAVLDTITKTLKKGDRVAITGFGSFEVRKRAARTARNPQTGEKIKIKASKVPAFKPGQGLKDAVSGAKKK